MIYLYLFLEFFKIGLFTFGGGYAMIPLVRDVVVSHEWISEDAFYEFIGVCESTPGPIAINMATFVGQSQGGVLGAFLATLGVVLPSLIVIILVATILKKIMNNKYVNAFLDGVKPVVIGLITFTGLLLVFKCIGFKDINNFVFDYKSLIILSILAIIFYGYKLIFKKKMNNILLIILSAGIGLLFMVF